MAQRHAETNGLSTISTCFEIVETLRERKGASLAEVADVHNMPSSTAYIYLKSLEDAGFVIHEDGLYRLGLKFLQIGGELRSDLKVFQVAKNEIDELAEETNELVDLAVWENGKRVLLYKSEGEDAVHDNLPIGDFMHMHHTPLGMAILAHLDRSTIDEILRTHGLPEITENTVTDREELFEELEVIRERGYTLNDQDWAEGIRGIGTPILNEQRDVLGSISVTGPQSRLRGDYFRETLPEVVLNTRNVIEIKIKHY